MLGEDLESSKDLSVNNSAHLYRRDDNGLQIKMFTSISIVNIYIHKKSVPKTNYQLICIYKHHDKLTPKVTWVLGIDNSPSKQQV